MLAILSQNASLGGLVVNQSFFLVPLSTIFGFSTFRFAIAASFAVLVVACGNSGCSINKKMPQTHDGVALKSVRVSKSSNPPASLAVARVKPVWQKNFMERAKELKAVEAWGLFSEGGWVDDGQTMVFVVPEGLAEVEAVFPGGRAASKLKPISAADVLLFRKNMASLDGLEDHIEAVFDAVQYELVHLVPLESEAQLGVKTRIMMVLPTEQKAPKHLALLKAIKAIRQERANQ